MRFVEVDSLHDPARIRAIGFDVISEDLEMLRWLRKGNDVSKVCSLVTLKMNYMLEIVALSITVSAVFEKAGVSS
ncbi:hypothetical protein P4S72_14795 [Vibrio sp. PP-XX7]